ncbi:hypothetical protein RF11_14392 [Thelohanellus kitauei]|uniref:Integrase catalytic domain-containing protein n=1 Tax=Thelohanellus kitauei TaxID=669202 RepID=A0A0C2IJC4_THEKT|nr:hypothetical protein RF11_14392 [Thelohanellus kitauei]
MKRVESCTICQISKKSSHRFKGIMNIEPSSYTTERLFDQLQDAYALPHMETETVENILVKEFICRFGSPKTTHTDQGKIEIKTRTTTYRPQSDGLIERFNPTLIQILRIMTNGGTENKWDDYKPTSLLVIGKNVKYRIRKTEIIVKNCQLKASLRQKANNNNRFIHIKEYKNGNKLWVVNTGVDDRPMLHIRDNRPSNTIQDENKATTTVEKRQRKPAKHVGDPIRYKFSDTSDLSEVVVIMSITRQIKIRLDYIRFDVIRISISLSDRKLQMACSGSNFNKVLRSAFNLECRNDQLLPNLNDYLMLSLDMRVANEPKALNVFAYLKNGDEDVKNITNQPHASNLQIRRFRRQNRTIILQRCSLLLVSVSSARRLWLAIFSDIIKHTVKLGRLDVYCREHPYINQNVEVYVQGCNECQQNGPNKHETPLSNWAQFCEPWGRVHIDYSQSPDKKNSWLVIVDVGPKWIEVYPVQTTTAGKTIHCLRDCFARFGVPKQILSDNRKQLTSKEFDEFCQIRGVKALSIKELYTTGLPFIIAAIIIILVVMRSLNSSQNQEKVHKQHEDRSTEMINKILADIDLLERWSSVFVYPTEVLQLSSSASNGELDDAIVIELFVNDLGGEMWAEDVSIKEENGYKNKMTHFVGFNRDNEVELLIKEF